MTLALPTTEGWSVVYYTGETITKKNGKVLRFKRSYESTSKPRVEAKAKELAEQGFEVIGIYECIF